MTAWDFAFWALITSWFWAIPVMCVMVFAALCVAIVIHGVPSDGGRKDA